MQEAAHRWLIGSGIDELTDLASEHTATVIVLTRRFGTLFVMNRRLVFCVREQRANVLLQTVLKFD